MIRLKDYSFLEPLVEDNKVRNSAPFNNDGFCLADKKKNPNCAYVFFMDKDSIWCAYTWTKKINKHFLKFHKEVENFLRTLKKDVFTSNNGNVFKNHIEFINFDDGLPIYKYNLRGT